MGYYDVAQICLNGHIINSTSSSSPELNKPFCGECGAKTIRQCKNCNSNINGQYHVPGLAVFSTESDTAPNYCHNCGKAYPWTQLALDSIEELLAIENSLSSDELSYLHDNMNSILVNTPKSKLIATKLKLSLSKLSSETTSAIRDILVDIASETAKKIIFHD